MPWQLEPKGLFQKKDTKVAICIDCHGKHDISGISDPSSSAHHKSIAETCAGCHADEDYMLPYGLVTNQLTAYNNSYHGMIIKGDSKGSHFGPVSIEAPDQRAEEECKRYGKRIADLTIKLFG